MKDAFKLFATIVVFVFLVDKMVYFVINKIDSQIVTGRGTGKLNYFLKTKDSTRYLIFGSSRANHHLDPSTLGKSAFNMGMDATKLAYSCALIKTLPRNKEQTIFLHVDANLIFDAEYQGEDISFLKRKYHKNEIISYEIDKLNQNNIFSWFLWSADFNGELGSLFKDYFLSRFNNVQYDGYDPIVVSSEQKKILSTKVETIDHKNCSDVNKPSITVLTLLRDIKEFSDLNRKQLILFTSPLYYDNCKQNNEGLENLLGELGIAYYDFSDFFQKGNSVDYWKDRSHLSKEGAEMFSAFFYKNVDFKAVNVP